ncbi:MAG: outer membrane lipoprotein carrier protein LolA [Alphaproteobacteria bacterium]|nr:MAG: outer membrane lipoprotein carrier protein LolA [Alphaproteobacteria bacterium]
MGPENEETEYMRGYYGILTGLAIVLTAGQVIAAPVSGSTAGTTVRTATVRQASVTVVDETAMPGLSGPVRQVEDYFNDLSTYQAAFTQTVTGEATPSKGTFSLKRPGRFLWQYDTPTRQKIVSTGSAAYYIDQERNQTTQLPMNAGVARLFNAKTLNMSKQGLRATRVRTNSQLMVVDFAVDKKIATGDNTGLTKLTLTFARLPGNNLRLTQLEGLDTLGVTTTVAFADIQENVSLPNSLFAYTPGVYEQRN